MKIIQQEQKLELNDKKLYQQIAQIEALEKLQIETDDELMQLKQQNQQLNLSVQHLLEAQMKLPGSGLTVLDVASEAINKISNLSDDKFMLIDVTKDQIFALKQLLTDLRESRQVPELMKRIQQNLGEIRREFANKKVNTEVTTQQIDVMSNQLEQTRKLLSKQYGRGEDILPTKQEPQITVTGYSRQESTRQKTENKVLVDDDDDLPIKDFGTQTYDSSIGAKDK